MIGGELEGIDMYTHSSAGDKTIDNNLIEIHEGDEVSWIFRCMYRPSVTSNHRTLWYLSESDEMSNYILDNGAHVTLPVPAQLNSAANKALYFFGGKNENEGSSFGDLTVYYYLLDEETENGISDLWTNYGTSGSDCKLVVVNLDTGLFNSVDIKNYTQNTIIIRGNALVELSSLVNIPEEVNTLKSLNKTETVVLSTSYNGTSCNQEFPFTERGDGYRTFFLPYDGRLRITFESNFDMDTISVTQNEHATESFVMGSVFIEENKRNASIVFSTAYYEKYRIEKEKDEKVKIQSLTDNGIYLFKINDNLIYIRVISYDNDEE